MGFGQPQLLTMTGGRGIFTLFAISLIFLASQLPSSQAAKRRYFKFGGNWKSWRDQLDEDTSSWSKGRSMFGRRSLPDARSVHTETRDVLENSQVELSCGVDRHRYPKVSWSRYGQPLPTNVRENDDKILFPYIQLGDAGTYVCTASNDWDTKEIQTKLTVHPSDRFREQVGPPSSVSSCRQDQATCRSGECIARGDLCDGDVDCRDGSDEQHCGGRSSNPGECEPNEFKCTSGKCIQRMWHCDGDDDCGDKSDEQNCGQRQPGEQCAPYEFKCNSQNQCVPLAYQCDKNNDCFDGSDEVGCAGPTVVEPPRRDVAVRCGETIVLTCRTIGVPVPYVNWRLNWGPVCAPPRCTQTSSNGVGTLTIRNAQDGDQGAYTCEAVNVANRILATPDAIVRVDCGSPVVKPDCDPRGTLPIDDGSGRCPCKPQTTGPKCDQCSPGSFHLSESNPHGCIQCFCSGVTKVCQSSSWYRTQERLVFALDDQDVTLSDRDKSAPVADFDQSRYRGYITHSGRHIGTLYWHLPSRLLGNKITAYGGKLKFNFQYAGSGPSDQKPLVMIKGHDVTAVYRGQASYESERTHDIVIDMYENQWVREDGQPMTREHFLMLLADLDGVMIRATHAQQHTSTSLGEIGLDVAVPINTQQDRAMAVEECQCPEGYQGLSCEECASGYQRSGGGLYLGTCVRAPVSPLLVRVEPRVQEEDEGSSVTFRAIVDGGGGGGGPFTYTWSRVGYPGLPSNAVVDRDTLTINDLRIEDYGTYRCTVTTSAGGTGSGEGELKVRRVGVCPYVWIEPIKSWRGQPGERVEFHCKAIGEPTPRIYWARADGRPLDPNARDQGEGTLIIDSVDQRNYGQYVCHGENRAGKNTANATVAEGGAAERGISVRIEPANLIASKRYDTVQVRCVASGTPTPTIAWTREDGSPLYSNAQDQGNGVLRIIGIEKINAGLYRCTARNQFTQASDIANVLPPTDIRSVPPIVVINPRELEARIGDDARIDCTAVVDNRDPSPRFVWSRQGGRALDADARDSGDGKLVVSNFQPHHAGVYECIAYGIHSKSIGTAVLRLKPESGAPPPVPEVTPKIQTVVEGDQVEFKCKVEGAPTAAVTWGFGSASGPLIGNARQENGQLIIEGAQSPANEGQYFCTATNAVGSNSASGTLYIERAQTLPKVNIGPQSHWSGKLGSDFQFHCTAKGNPAPKVIWTREDENNFEDNVKADNDGRLTISKSKNTNRGKYICTATSSVGEDWDAVTVDVDAQVSAKILYDGKEAGESINVEENSPFKLECVGVGDPEPKVGWSVDVGPSRGDVPKGYKSVEIYNQFVVHDGVTRANEGTYKCNASNEFGVAEDTVKVHVVPKGKRQVVILGGSDRPTSIGNPMELRCLVTDAESQYTLRWERKNAFLPVIHTQPHQGVLIVPEFNQRDAGVYECHAFDAKTARVVSSDEVKVSADGDQELVTVVKVESGPIKHVSVGETVELKCTAPVNPTDVRSELQWFLVSQGNFRPIAKENVINGVLRIAAATMDDAGVYSCVRYLDDQRDGSYQVAVIVSNTETTAKQVEAESNSPLELHCPVFRVSGMEYEWKRVSETQLPPGVDKSNRVLRIPNFETDYAGTYECDTKTNGVHAKGFVQVVGKGMEKLAAILRPINTLTTQSTTQATTTPTTTTTAATTVSLTRPASKPFMELTMEVMPDYAYLGKDVILRCSVSAEPKAQIRWERIGRPLPRTAYITGQQLKLRKLQVGDIGRYRCSATTKVGPISVETVLKIGEKLSGNVIRRYYDL